MSEFRAAMQKLCSEEIADALRDPSRGAEMISALCANLATTVAFTMLGDPKGIDELLTGISNVLYEDATRTAPTAALLRVGRAS